jgi:hypothetical protein
MGKAFAQRAVIQVKALVELGVGERAGADQKLAGRPHIVAKQAIKQIHETFLGAWQAAHNR